MTQNHTFPYLKEASALLLAIFLGGLSSCKNDTQEPILPTLTLKALSHQVISIENNGVALNVVKAPSQSYRLLEEKGKGLRFIASSPGKYLLEGQSEGKKQLFEIEVTAPETPYTTGVDKVYEYVPAPGQFVNKIPEWKEGDTQESMNRKAQEALQNKEMITLGSWGGYVVFGFDHTVINLENKKDFKVLGNAFQSINHAGGGSSEPGVIQVAYDTNGNGIPDDEWYEIAGSATKDPSKESWYRQAIAANIDIKTYRKYSVTYHAPTPNSTPEKHIAWEDNASSVGYIPKNEHHLQNYYPQWIKDPKKTYHGTRLPQNAILQEDGIILQMFFAYGYADNLPNLSKESEIDLDWAIDKDGNSVSLLGIDFVRVHTGVFQINGEMGEASTEVAGAEDLSLDKP